LVPPILFEICSLSDGHPPVLDLLFSPCVRRVFLSTSHLCSNFCLFRAPFVPPPPPYFPTHCTHSFKCLMTALSPRTLSLEPFLLCRNLPLIKSFLPTDPPQTVSFAVSSLFFLTAVPFVNGFFWSVVRCRYLHYYFLLTCPLSERSPPLGGGRVPPARFGRFASFPAANFFYSGAFPPPTPSSFPSHSPYFSSPPQSSVVLSLSSPRLNLCPLCKLLALPTPTTFFSVPFPVVFPGISRFFQSNLTLTVCLSSNVLASPRPRTAPS